MEKIKEPTEEQIAAFWEWCGFQRHFGGEWIYERHKSTNAWWEAPDGRKYKDLPPIDLNNLFKYAAPKLRELKYYVVLRDISKGFHCSLVYTTAEKQSYYGESNDPALALFWSIWKVIPHEN